MQHWLLASFLLASLTAHAQTCPRLEGTFECKSSPPFDLKVENEWRAGVASYTLTDPTGSRNFVTDHEPHPMDFSQGKGEYRAWCEGDRLFVEAHSPDGRVLLDRYYIERAALVRVRTSPQASPSSLSCAPTHGTWNLYPH